MKTLTFNTERKLKQFVNENRKNIHQKINEKVGINITKAVDLDIYPLDYLIDKYDDLLSKDDDIIDKTYRTASYAFGIDYGNESLIRHNCYQYLCRNVKKMNLKEIYKYEGKSQFKRVMNDTKYFLNIN